MAAGYSIKFSFDVFKLINFFCLFGINEFYVQGTLHRNSVSINIQQDAAIHSLFCLYRQNQFYVLFQASVNTWMTTALF